MGQGGVRMALVRCGQGPAKGLECSCYQCLHSQGHGQKLALQLPSALERRRRERRTALPLASAASAKEGLQDAESQLERRLGLQI